MLVSSAALGLSSGATTLCDVGAEVAVTVPNSIMMAEPAVAPAATVTTVVVARLRLRTALSRSRGVQLAGSCGISPCWVVPWSTRNSLPHKAIRLGFPSGKR